MANDPVRVHHDCLGPQTLDVHPAIEVLARSSVAMEREDERCRLGEVSGNNDKGCSLDAVHGEADGLLAARVLPNGCGG